MRSFILGVGVMVVLASASPATAQSQPASPRGRELSVGVVFAGPASLGSSSAEFIQPNGTPLELFRTKNRFGPRYGAEAHLTYQLTRWLWAEGTGSWSRGNLESRIEADSEGADLVTASTGLSRFTVEGGVLLPFMARRRMAWFARGTAGWMRELSGGSVLAEDGVVGNVGIGVKYWWGEASTGRRRTGLRVEARAHARSRGVTLGEDKMRVAGALFAGLIFGW